MPGLHFMLDGFKVTKFDLMEEIPPLEEWLNALPAKIGMNILIPATLARVQIPEVSPQEVGITGFVVIVQSHISIHTYPNLKKFHADIFSCKQFDAVKVFELFQDVFGFREWEARTIERAIGV